MLLRRVMKRDNRPLLKAGDPEAVMRRLMEQRYPIYAEADLIVESRDVPHEVIVAEILAALGRLSGLAAAEPRSETGRAMVRHPAGPATALTRSSDITVRQIHSQCNRYHPADAAATVPVALGERSYEVLIGPGLLARARRPDRRAARADALRQS